VDGSPCSLKSDSRTRQLIGEHAHLPRLVRILTRMTHLPSTVRRPHKSALAYVAITGCGAARRCRRRT
jgi:hypothetical protein